MSRPRYCIIFYFCYSFFILQILNACIWISMHSVLVGENSFPQTDQIQIQPKIFSMIRNGTTIPTSLHSCDFQDKKGVQIFPSIYTTFVFWTESTKDQTNVVLSRRCAGRKGWPCKVVALAQQENTPLGTSIGEDRVSFSAWSMVFVIKLTEGHETSASLETQKNCWSRIRKGMSANTGSFNNVEVAICAVRKYVNVALGILIEQCFHQVPALWIVFY